MLVIPTTIPAELSCLAFSPDGRHLAIARGAYLDLKTTSNTLEIIEIASLSIVGTADSPRGAQRVWFSQTGQLFVANWSETFDFGTQFHGKLGGEPVTPPELGRPLGFSPDGMRAVFTFGTDQRIELTYVEQQDVFKPKWSQRIPSNAHRCAAVSPDGTTILTARWNSQLLSRDPGTGQVVQTYNLRDRIVELHYTHDGTKLVGRTQTGSPLVWDDCNLAKHPRVVSAKIRRNIRGMAVHPNSTHALVTTNDGPVVVCPLQGAKQADRAFNWNIGSTHAVAIRADGLLAATIGESGTIVVWDLEL
jgi:WD40 repeat protein